MLFSYSLSQLHLVSEATTWHSALTRSLAFGVGSWDGGRGYVGNVPPSRFSRSPNFDVITCETGPKNNPESHSKHWRLGIDTVKPVETILRNQWSEEMSFLHVDDHD